MEKLKRLPFRAQNAVFDRLERVVDIATLTREERIKYDESIKVYRDNLAVMAFERQSGFEEGRMEGMIEGRMEGKKEGERSKQEEIARKMRSMGLPTEMIAETTGLSPAEVEAL